MLSTFEAEGIRGEWDPEARQARVLFVDGARRSRGALTTAATFLADWAGPVPSRVLIEAGSGRYPLERAWQAAFFATRCRRARVAAAGLGPGGRLVFRVTAALASMNAAAFPSGAQADAWLAAADGPRGLPAPPPRA